MEDGGELVKVVVVVVVGKVLRLRGLGILLLSLIISKGTKSVKTLRLSILKRKISSITSKGKGKQKQEAKCCKLMPYICLKVK